MRRTISFLMVVILLVAFAGPSLGVESKKENFFKESQDKSTKKKLEDYMEALVKFEEFNGNILVAKRGEILLNKAYGYRDIENKILMTTEDKMLIGSVSKQFTAMAIMQLVERGAISLEDTMDMYVEGFKYGDKIKIHHLLSHSSGLKDYSRLIEVLELDRQRPSKENIYDLVKDLDLEYSPGNRYNYSNTNYVVLSDIIERLTGKSYGEYMEENIFKPLNMDKTGLYKPGENFKVKPHMGFSKINERDEEFLLGYSFGAGSIYSTVEDLYRWDRALNTESLVKSQTLDKMFKGYNKIDKENKSAYGWKVRETKEGKIVSHKGNTLGFTSLIVRDLGNDLSIIILTNKGQYNIEPKADDIRSIILGKAYKLPNKLENPNIKDLKSDLNYEGNYRLGTNYYVRIYSQGDKIIADLPILGKLDLVVLDQDYLFSKEKNIKIKLIRDGKENVKKIYIEAFKLEGIRVGE